MVSTDRIKELFREFADKHLSFESVGFGDDMFVEWEGNEKTRLEAQGFYSGFRIAEQIFEGAKNTEQANQPDSGK